MFHLRFVVAFTLICGSFSFHASRLSLSSRLVSRSVGHGRTLADGYAAKYNRGGDICPVRATSILAASTLTDDNVIKAEGSGSVCRIKVIGVGGGGGNAVNRMIESSQSIPGVDMWVVNTDAQALSRSLATNRLNIGKVLSR